jgi:threonyl-tRNA synthetase
MNNQDKLSNLRHSTAHLLAAAVLELYPDTKRAIGPAIDSGFYYDFDFSKPISEEDFPRIEQKMHELLKTWDKFERIELDSNTAIKQYSNEPYKLELIEEFSKAGEKLTIYKSGSYEDLCHGGHSENPRKDIGAFKLLSIAGAYWRGSEKNMMLTRIYGTAFGTKKELDDYLLMLEEAKKRDHRKLGEQLELFTICEEVGQGLILWLPKGNIIKEELEAWAKKTENQWGYKRVTTPNITKAGLYYTSGHLPYYKNDMYPPMKLDNGDEYYLKPMNCPHHHMIYKSKPKSYRDLPLRLAEYGTCYRYEATGELFGMMRVRGFAQNDAHIYCTVDQAVDEFVTVMKLHEYYYKQLGITEYHLELALRDPKKTEKYHGDDKMWELAEKLMREAVKKTDIRMVEEIGSAAFYGPKIDFVVRSSIGREFAVSTNQIDLYMGDRFKLKYTDNTGSEQTPVVIHRAPLGSHERFIGFLIEHYGGNFPLWIAPVQIELLPIADRHIEYAQKVYDQLNQLNIRVNLNAEKATLQAKIRIAALQKVPFMGIIGDKEVQSAKFKDQNLIDGLISVRTREGEDLGQKNVTQFISELKEKIDQKT